jgi:hypothetical protein
VAPNVESVDITVYLKWTYLSLGTGADSPSSDPDFFTDEEKKLRQYCSALGPLQGRNIFSQMRHLHIRAFLPREPPNVQVVQKAIEEMCTLRKDAGGLELGVESFQVLYFDRKWLIETYVSVLD